MSGSPVVLLPRGGLFRGFAVGLAAVLAMPLLAAPASAVSAAAVRSGGRPPVQHQPSVPGHSKAPAPALAALDQVAALAWRGAPAVRWSTAGSATVDLGALASSATVRAGALPVSVGRAGTHTSPNRLAPASSTRPATGRVRVDVLGRAATERAGVRGLVFRLSRPDGPKSAGRVSVGVDYSQFRYAYGGDWASRLRLVRLPSCALSTPAAPGCETGAPLPTHNDVPAGQLTADVDLPAGTAPLVLAVTAAPSGPAGDYTATKLSPSATWQVSTQTGDFAWTYPMRTPPSPGGLDPDLSLSYSSGSVDGRTVSTNNQTSWIGEGFDYWPGAIVRGYDSCADDGVSTKPGDECWAGDNATLSMNGHATELVRDDATGTWRPKDDDGSRVEKLTGAANGDDNGEYWRITTTDGTQFYFGRNRLPGWTSGDRTTGSVWTVPVFGDDAGEPCHAATFDASWCQQAWQWNLDYVVDPHGNAMSLFYTPETNYYSRNLSTAKATQYDRGGYLTEIDYGQRSGSMYSASAPARVLFGVTERCIPTSTFDCAASTFTSANAKHWPDVPFDRYCAKGATCTDDFSPTFWSRKMLATVRTQVRSGSSYRTVDTWTLTHQFPASGDGTAPALWLASIGHTGNVGSSASVPKVTFGGVQMDNRVDTLEGLPPLFKWRISAISNETGGQLSIAYTEHDCVAGQTPAPDSNARRCFPQYWTPEGAINPQIDWFHKYAVAQVITLDRTGGSAEEVSTYSYSGPAWRYATDDGLTKKKYRTWSQWRGFARVTVIHGDVSEQRSKTTYLYLQGMDGDRRSDGTTRHVTVTDSQGGTITDADELSGFLREEITDNGPGGPVVSGTVYDPFIHGPTATRVRSWGTTKAFVVEVGATHTRTALAAGGWRRTETYTSYNDQGLVTEVNDLGDTSTAADDLCTRTSYARNTSAWLLDTVDRTETVSVNCATTPSRPDDVVSDERTYYDGLGFGVAPVHGDATRTEEIASYTGGTPDYVTTATTSYDSYGRVTSTADAAGHTTTTAYTPASGGLATKTVVTNPAGHVTTTELEPAWGLPTAKTDPNGKHTELAYDPLGRLTAVWLPGQDRATEAANLVFGYTVRTTGPVAVSTGTLRNDGASYTTSYALFDGYLRPRQTQKPAPGGGRVITDTIYDSRGLVAKTNEPYYNEAEPGTDLFVPASDDDVPGQTVTVYDGAERKTAEIFRVRGSERWRTTTTYGGDRTSVTPPAGGTPTTTVTDARGHTTELFQYHGSTPTGDADVTRYTYTPTGDLATVTDPAGNRWTYHYDLRGRQVRVDDPDKGTTVMTYDDLDQLASTTDARGTTIAYRYDALGRKTGEFLGSTDGPKLAQWTYDTLAKGQQTSSTRFVDGTAYTTAVVGYDDQYRPTGTSVTIPAAEGALAGTYTSFTDYNLDGTVHRTSIPAAGRFPAETMLYDYDELGEPTTTHGFTSYVTNTTYSKLGQVVQQTFAAGGKRVIRTNTFEEGTNRLARVLFQRETSPVTIADTHYTYDPAGNITSIADTPAGQDADTQCFDYDYLRRLTEAWTSTEGCAVPASSSVIGGPAPYWQSFSYDVTGNRISETDHGLAGAPDAVHTYTYPQPGQPHPHALATVTTAGGPADGQVDSYGYDAVGNTTSRLVAGTDQTLTFDVEGNLSSLTEHGQTTTFLYDADGNLLIRRDPGATTLFLGNQEVRLDTATNTTSVTRYYAQGGETFAARTLTGLTWLLPDQHGTDQVAVDEFTQQVTHRRFTPFGQPRGATPATWPGTLGFVGGYIDGDTGLTTLGAREYDPVTGRFDSVDPVIDPDDPQQMNGYAYANNSPVTNSDPSGLCFGRDFGDLCPTQPIDRQWQAGPIPHRHHKHSRHFVDDALRPGVPSYRPPAFRPHHHTSHHVSHHTNHHASRRRAPSHSRDKTSRAHAPRPHPVRTPHRHLGDLHVHTFGWCVGGSAAFGYALSGSICLTLTGHPALVFTGGAGGGSPAAGLWTGPMFSNARRPSDLSGHGFGAGAGVEFGPAVGVEGSVTNNSSGQLIYEMVPQVGVGVAPIPIPAEVHGGYNYSWVVGGKPVRRAFPDMSLALH